MSLIRLTIPVSFLFVFAISEAQTQVSSSVAAIFVELKAVPAHEDPDEKCGQFVLRPNGEPALTVFLKDPKTLRLALEGAGLHTPPRGPRGEDSDRLTIPLAVLQAGNEGRKVPSIEITSTGPPRIRVALHGVSFADLKACGVHPG